LRVVLRVAGDSAGAAPSLRERRRRETNRVERARETIFSVDVETSEPVSNAKRLCPSSTLYVAADEKNGTERFFCEKYPIFFARKSKFPFCRSESERRANPFRGAKGRIGPASRVSCEKCERLELSFFREQTARRFFSVN
jgi:hypothetical protein